MGLFSGCYSDREVIFSQEGLMEAIDKKKPGLVERLCADPNADVNFIKSREIQIWSVEPIRKFLERKFLIRWIRNLTPLSLAVIRNDASMVKTLLDKGARVDIEVELCISKKKPMVCDALAHFLDERYNICSYSEYLFFKMPLTELPMANEDIKKQLQAASEVISARKHGLEGVVDSKENSKRQKCS